MAKRNIVWTFTAQKQRREILKYWTLKNGSSKYAEKLIKLIRERLKIISNNPTTFRKSGYKDVHVSSMGYFSLFYTYNDEEIVVVSFWDNRQDHKKLLTQIHP